MFNASSAQHEIPQNQRNPLNDKPSTTARDDEPLIQVEGVSKKFCLSLKKSLWYGLKDMGNELLGRRHGGGGQLRPKEFWAVNDVSFELRRGECLGLIGRNGAGKTTLLKMLNGLIKPDAGKITMRGRVGALIALGAGFNAILTGRENIYTNASILGMTKKEIDAKMDEIIDFAEIGDFIDTPVQNYSSGMAVRLGFAVAATLDPSVLLLDEVLAVGDMAFRMKCFNAISAMAKNAAVILVSHSMQDISRICSRVIYMEKGAIRYAGEEVDKGINLYINDSPSGMNRPTAMGHGATFSNVMVNGIAMELCPIRVRSLGPLRLSVDLQLEEPSVSDACLAVVFFNSERRNVLELHSLACDGVTYKTIGCSIRAEIKLDRLPLMPGRYGLTLHTREANAANGISRELGRIENAAQILVEGDGQVLATPVALPAQWSFTGM